MLNSKAIHNFIGESPGSKSPSEDIEQFIIQSSNSHFLRLEVRPKEGVSFVTFLLRSGFGFGGSFGFGRALLEARDNIYDRFSSKDSDLCFLFTDDNISHAALADHGPYLDIERLADVKGGIDFHISEVGHCGFFRDVGDGVGVFLDGEVNTHGAHAVFAGVQGLGGLDFDRMDKVEPEVVPQVLAGSDIGGFDDWGELALDDPAFDFDVDGGVGVLGELGGQVEAVIEGHVVALEVDGDEVHLDITQQILCQKEITHISSNLYLINPAAPTQYPNNTNGNSDQSKYFILLIRLNHHHILQVVGPGQFHLAVPI